MKKIFSVRKPIFYARIFSMVSKNITLNVVDKNFQPPTHLIYFPEILITVL